MEALKAARGNSKGKALLSDAKAPGSVLETDAEALSPPRGEHLEGVLISWKEVV